MTRLFTLFFMLLSLALSGQNDTVIYYSAAYKPIGSPTGASYKDHISRVAKNEYLLAIFKKTDDKWERSFGYEIKIKSDSTLTVNSERSKKNITTRYYHKNDSGYYIKDYKNSILCQKGYSRMLFPIIKDGYWEIYNEETGKIRIQGNYRDNSVVNNKYWVSETLFIEDVYFAADKMPEYEGGEKAIAQHVIDKIQYPIQAREDNITGMVVIGFIVKKDGSVDGFHYIKKVHPNLDFEALRVIASLPRKWTPAELDNRKVNVVFSLPVTFQIK